MGTASATPSTRSDPPGREVPPAAPLQRCLPLNCACLPGIVGRLYSSASSSLGWELLVPLPAPPAPLRCTAHVGGAAHPTTKRVLPGRCRPQRSWGSSHTGGAAQPASPQGLLQTHIAQPAVLASRASQLAVLTMAFEIGHRQHEGAAGLLLLQRQAYCRSCWVKLPRSPALPLLILLARSVHVGNGKKGWGKAWKTQSELHERPEALLHKASPQLTSASENARMRGSMACPFFDSRTNA